MPKFTVRVIAETTVYADIEIEAANRDKAEEMALDKARDGIAFEVSEGNTLDWDLESND